MRLARPRLAVRAAVLHRDRLLMVNAYPGQDSDLWCLPGGGVEPGQSLPENLMREVAEETGLIISVGAPFLVNEFHDPASGFHQVEIHFRAMPVAGDDISLADPMGVVNRFRWVTRAELATLRHKPGSLAAALWGDAAAHYDALETIVP
ncbi:NUDIX hydrolase [Paracoccus sp. R12_1]|uniref:NUDIX domain-containing protein n=1 Tax=unclassified Paracoccus (in: a-proteobacteria) TaxID=2688777 RepID=UPI001ADD0787|nr:MULTISPECIES: NUDIX hydrolase [unclassified Paracoccus (in: a-proteobacteria)]MBO9457191.1 NUDIX hydrolase [Paracoccus sp. R12_2]MBO9488510.1 NUDIX hydrolase [Paracoccus sp. R12_1]